VAAFYALLECLFYSFAGPLRRDRFHMFRLLLPIRSEVEKVVHWMPEILFAAEITFRRLDGCVPQQELNLLQLATARVAQLRTSPPQIVWRNVLQARSLAAALDYVPHDILRDTFSPHLPRSRNSSKDPSFRDLGCYDPLIECRFDPLWNRHRADVATLTDQVYHGPVPLTNLDFIQLQANKFRPTKTTTKKQGQHGVVALSTHATSTRTLEYVRTLLRAQPISRAKPKLFDSFHTADPRRQLRTQQA
jgi:hypothetical protein